MHGSSVGSIEGVGGREDLPIIPDLGAEDAGGACPGVQKAGCLQCRRRGGTYIKKAHRGARCGIDVDVGAGHKTGADLSI